MQNRTEGIIVCEKCGKENYAYATYCAYCGNSFYKDIYKGLRKRNVFVTLLLFFLPFVILFYIVNYEVSANFEKHIKTSLDYSVEVNARIMKSFLEEREKNLLSINQIEFSDINEIKRKSDTFIQFLKNNEWFDFIAVADTDGEIIFSSIPIKANISNREYFKKALTGELFNSSIFYSDILHRNALVLSAPLFNQSRKIIGVVIVSVNLTKFYSLILDLRMGKTSEIFLVDEQGKFLSPSKLGGEVLKEAGYYQKEPNPHQGEGKVITHRDYRGEKVLCAYRRFSRPNWYLVSEIDIKEALAPVNSLKRIILVIFIIFGTFLFSSAIFFSNQITNLLKSLTSNLKSAFDDISSKKALIDKINVELRNKLKECENLSKKLGASERYIKSIIDSITSAMLAIDKNHFITYYNNFAKNFFKIPDGKKNLNLFEISPLFADEEIKNKIEGVFTNNISFIIEKKTVVIDGNSYILNISGFPVESGEGVHSVALLINDITAYENMRTQMADYEKLSALSQLALGAAHEINNPLLGITSFLEMLIEEEVDIEKKTRAKEVLENAYRISETIRGLLNFARPAPPKFTKVNLNDLINETISFLHHQPLFKKIKFQKNLSDTLPPITADINQIRQVLVNILLNAAQAIEDKGTITVSTSKIKFEDLVEVKISDTGVGIPEENLKRIFEPFFTTKKGKGTGLGLSISLTYIKNHNGNIIISSKVGEGTEVKITLPIRHEGRIASEVIDE
ncbi:MAG: cache domain-containing protein [candidate division WOR-3 bacterium]|nr:cache domain-containing protein [candidate division WOR-3 bacterium]